MWLSLQNKVPDSLNNKVSKYVSKQGIAKYLRGTYKGAQ